MTIEVAVMLDTIAMDIVALYKRSADQFTGTVVTLQCIPARSLTDACAIR